MSNIITRHWKSGNTTGKSYGKIYQKVLITQIMSTDQFAQHIASHGSPYTRDIIHGVLMKACDCLVELCMDSKAVRLSDLGIFKMAAHAEGVEDSKDATPDKVKRLELQFLPNRSKDYNLSSTNLAKKAQMVGIDQLSDGVSDGYTAETGGSTGSDTGSGQGDERP